MCFGLVPLNKIMSSLFFEIGESQRSILNTGYDGVQCLINMFFFFLREKERMAIRIPSPRIHVFDVLICTV